MKSRYLKIGKDRYVFHKIVSKEEKEELMKNPPPGVYFKKSYRGNFRMYFKTQTQPNGVSNKTNDKRTI